MSAGRMGRPPLWTGSKHFASSGHLSRHAGGRLGNKGQEVCLETGDWVEQFSVLASMEAEEGMGRPGRVRRCKPLKGVIQKGLGEQGVHLESLWACRSPSASWLLFKSTLRPLTWGGVIRKMLCPPGGKEQKGHSCIYCG